MEHTHHSNTEIKDQKREAEGLQGFLCYCHKDFRYANRLRVHLAGCQHVYGLTLWDDSQIQAGSFWQNDIDSHLSAAHFAILLISADFLASPFITSFELPRILSAVQSGGTRILPVIVGSCLFEESPLAAFQAINDPARPLSSLTPAARDQVWVRVVRALIHAPLHC